MHPLELVWSWQPLKPLMTLGLVHAGRLTVTRGMQGLLSAPCQTISATTGKIPARCEKSTKTAERHTHLCADRCTSAQPKLTARTYLVICASSAKLKWRAALRWLEPPVTIRVSHRRQSRPRDSRRRSDPFAMAPAQAGDLRNRYQGR